MLLNYTEGTSKGKYNAYIELKWGEAKEKYGLAHLNKRQIVEGEI